MDTTTCPVVPLPINDHLTDTLPTDQPIETNTNTTDAQTVNPTTQDLPIVPEMPVQTLPTVTDIPAQTDNEDLPDAGLRRSTRPHKPPAHLELYD